MSGTQETKQTSPWRAVFERVRHACGGKRDDNGVIGSINWLRNQMAFLGANPNVVRNIIYRDKGRASDKRVLFDIFNSLWQEAGHAPLQAPELELLLASGGPEGEVAQLLGRETRRAYRSFVSGVRGFEQPKLLITGRPGSGKTVLTDYLQQALETAPEVAGRVVRLEFSHPDLGVSLARLGDALGVPETLFEARLVKIGLSTAFAVQADAQAGVARLLLDALKRSPGLVLLLHISQSLAGQDSLAGVPLRLHSDEVPRVTAAEWLWLSLLEPASRYKHLSLLVTMAEAPPRVVNGLGAFAGPLKLAPPTASEAKRFVRSKLPHLRAALQDDIAKQAGRSYEDLRILTLLAEERDPNPQGGLSETAGIVDTMEGRLELLSSLVETAEDPALRDFLRVLAVLSLPEFPNFSSAALKAMGQEGWEGGSALARAFLDAAPGGMGESAEDTLAGAEQWRCFSRRLGRSLRDKLARYDPEGYRGLHLKASRFYEPQAAAQPASEAAARYLQHLFEARSWQDLQRWLARYNARQILIRQVWHAAERELTARFELESVALQVARYYVRLASYHHPEAEAALALLASSEDAEIRAWTQLKRAEGAMYKGRYDVAETLLEPWPQVADPTLTADYELARASVARWRGQLAKAAEHISLRAQPLVNEASGQKRHHERHHDLVRAKVALWGGLIAKDQGNLELALRHFGEVESDDGLVQARQAFQKGDVQAKLGLFDTAKAELSRALELARASEAPATERARYLARRARVLRKRGEPARARDDFDEALRLLSRGGHPPLSDLELAFERAKVQDERAVNLIALGDSEGAILQLGENLETFTRYGRDYHVDAGFRILRNRLRLSLAYWARGSSQAYAMPFLKLAGYPATISKPANDADTEQAQSLVRSVRLHIAAEPKRSERYGPLYTQALLVASLLAGSGEEAVRCAEEAVKDARYSYQEALYGAFLAAAKLRSGEASEALKLSRRAQAAHAQARGKSGERGDLGLLAWLYSIDIRAQLTSPQGFKGAADKLSSSLYTPELAPYGEALLRCFGEGVEPYQRQGLLSAQDWLSHSNLSRGLSLSDVPGGASVRLPDELVARWRQLRGKPVGALAAD